MSRPARFAVQSQGAAALLILLVAGSLFALVSPQPIVIVACTAAIAGGGSLLADRRAWTPPGPIFFVFAFAVTSSIPAASIQVFAGALAAAASVGFTLVVTIGLSALEPAAAWSPSSSAVRKTVIGNVHAIVCLVGAATAGTIAITLGFDHPYWAIASVVPVVGHTTRGQFLRDGHRVIGMVAGLGMALSIFAVPILQLSLVVILVTLMALTELVIARNYGLAMLFLAPFTIGLLEVAGLIDLDHAVETLGIET